MMNLEDVDVYWAWRLLQDLRWRTIPPLEVLVGDAKSCLIGNGIPAEETMSLLVDLGMIRIDNGYRVSIIHQTIWGCNE